MKIEKIETERLFLRGFEKSDVPFAVSVWNDPEAGAYLPDPDEEHMDEEYRASLERLGDDEECCYLISERKGNGERIGTCSFIPSKDGAVYDIAYCVHKAFWRMGFATEMVGGMIGYAKKHGATKITARVNKQNIGSNAVMKKFGFRVTGEHSYQKQGTDLVFTDFLYELHI